MPIRLPAVGDQMSGWVKKGKATLASPPVMNNNGAHNARSGNASWVGNKLTFSDDGLTNYWYVPQAETVDNGISFCVVPCANKNQYAYVLSDNYGGCELHELWNNAFKLLAFIHVLRTGGITSPYTIANGWVRRSVIRSAPICRAGGAVGNNLSITCIDRGADPPVVQSKFIRVTSPPNVYVNVTSTVALEDDGTGPN